MEGDPNKERQPEFYMETTMTTQIERYSAVSDLARCGFEEEGYHVVDYVSDLQTAMSTTIR
uniref:Ulp1 protease-like n=1 Tax=Oryza sativa subsp. japonica TaxID=39947 RepID=Q6H823_ORYSJ|nr:hypothetical protein [Oryza sativa Japonica Group]